MLIYIWDKFNAIFSFLLYLTLGKLCTIFIIKVDLIHTKLKSNVDLTLGKLFNIVAVMVLRKLNGMFPLYWTLQILPWVRSVILYLLLDKFNAIFHFHCTLPWIWCVFIHHI